MTLPPTWSNRPLSPTPDHLYHTFNDSFFVPFHFYLPNSIQTIDRLAQTSGSIWSIIILMSVHRFCCQFGCWTSMSHMVMALWYDCNPGMNHPNTFSRNALVRKRSQRWVSEISPNETLSVLVGVAEWFKAVWKVSAESQTRGLTLATQVAFSKIISLSSRTCFFRPWQIKRCMLSCRQIEILMQIDKPVHVRRI